jgi:23S rRNA pseudouridine1911/1915/1917 synthase
MMSDAVGAQTVECVVTPEEGEMRLDRFLAAKLTTMSRARVQALLRAGHVTGPGGTIGEAGYRVKPHEVFRVEVPPPEPAEPEPERIPLDVVYEDEHLIVIDKPAGLVVHPGAGHGNGTLVNALLAHCGDSLSGIGGVMRPGIVHRLDKDTSGLLVVAKNDIAHQSLSEQFAAHGADGRMERAYLALCWGRPTRVSGTIDARLARSQKNRTKIAVVTGEEEGRHAVTHYEVLETYAAGDRKAAVSLLRLQLQTGRTHQIRVHLAHIGHPVLGDPLYASGFKTSANVLSAGARKILNSLGRQALHAAELGFEHPTTHRMMRFESPLPPDLKRLVRALEAGSH